jgi:hypothetical protein
VSCHRSLGSAHLRDKLLDIFCVILDAHIGKFAGQQGFGAEEGLKSYVIVNTVPDEKTRVLPELCCTWIHPSEEPVREEIRARSLLYDSIHKPPA